MMLIRNEHHYTIPIKTISPIPSEHAGFSEASIVFIHDSMPFWQKENPDFRVGAFHGSEQFRVFRVFVATKKSLIFAFLAGGGARIRGVRVNLAPGNFGKPSQITIAVTISRLC